MAQKKTESRRKKPPRRRGAVAAKVSTEAPATRGARSFPVVGVGASAGGLEAFTQLLRALPADTGMGFVLVQHLDPTHESILTELLSRATTMPVHEVSEGMLVEPNHVYVIPRKRDMMISHGTLKLLPRSQIRGQHMPIDFFLKSLAQEMGARAIGVILSGSASDGTLGLKAIKAEGGITFAQDEKSAKYDGMPRAAVASGSVDVVLPPEKIAAELIRLSRHPALATLKADRSEDIIPEERGDAFSKILTLLRKGTGIDFTCYKHSTIKRRIGRRMILQTMEGIDKYVNYLQKHPLEVEALAQDILIHVTGFFRDPEVFRVLKGKVFPKITEGRPSNSPIRVWVPGCSTGEEAYSIAMTLLEHLTELKESPPVQIFATDVNEPAIDRARVGIYSSNITSEVSAERLRRFFTKMESGGYQISKSVRDLCIFARQDLTKDPPFSNIDLISCRNVLIYLGQILQKKVLSFLHYALRPMGFLLLGSSESTGGFGELFTPMDKKHKIYAKKPMLTRPYPDYAQGQYGMERPEPPGTLPAIAAVRVPDPRKEVDRILLNKYAPPGVLVNGNLEILQFRGSTSPFLEPAPGEASLNLSRMAREGLMIEISAAIRRAKREGSTIRREGVRFNPIHAQQLNLEVVPIGSGKNLNFLILFESAERPLAAEGLSPKRTEKSVSEKRGKVEADRSARLQQELAATKEYLQAVIESQETTNEELRSAYEEIQSSNEELQSTNEELETAKEELQSTNEELTTVNETLQSKNSELGQLNNDLNNLLASINIPIVMLSNDLRIRRFTPMAEKVLNLIPSDGGRPIGNIKPNINVPELERIISEVIETLRIQEVEVQDSEGHWYSLRVRPYRTADNRIEGAVLALVSIDALKASLENIAAARDYAEAILDTVREPILILDKDLRVVQASRAYYQVFRTTAEEAVNRFLYELGNGQWNNSRLRLKLQEILPKDSRFDDFEIEWDSEGTGGRSMLVAGRRLRPIGDHPEQILLAISDVTERRQTTEVRYRQLLSTVQEGVVILDQTQQIVEANPGALRLLDRPVKEVVGQRFSEILAPDEVERWRAAVSTLKTDEQSRVGELRIASNDGHPIAVDCVCSAYLEAGQRMVQCLLVGAAAQRREGAGQTAGDR